MLITKVEIQKKHKDRVNIYVDGDFFCGLMLTSCIKYHIKEGVEIERDRLDFLRQETEREYACEKGLKYLSKSQKTEKEVKNYLSSKGFDDETIIYAIEKLKKYDYVNDTLYAKTFVKFKAKTDGKKKIEYELKQKGIADKIIQNALSEFDFDENVVETLLEKYLKNKALDLKTKQKAYRFLMSKGFSNEEILHALNKFFN